MKDFAKLYKITFNYLIKRLYEMDKAKERGFEYNTGINNILDRFKRSVLHQKRTWGNYGMSTQYKDDAE